MDLASVVAALASVGVRVSGSTPNNNIQEDSSRACPTGLAGPEPSGTHNDPGQHFQDSDQGNIDINYVSEQYHNRLQKRCGDCTATHHSMVQKWAEVQCQPWILGGPKQRGAKSELAASAMPS